MCVLIWFRLDKDQSRSKIDFVIASITQSYPAHELDNTHTTLNMPFHDTPTETMTREEHLHKRAQAYLGRHSWSGQMPYEMWLTCRLRGPGMLRRKVPEHWWD